ncbi:MAG: HRDC domain-containing protein [Verrucomicrobiales bacterium]
MKLSFFWIPACDSLAAADELNRFLAMHRVVGVEKRFCSGAGGHGPGWSVCVEWLPGKEMAEAATAPTGKVDYKAVLDGETFRIFAALRNWRKEAAGVQGVPIYTVATNEQLAEVARQRVTTKAGLETIEGFGAARMARQGDELLAACRKAIALGKEGTP